MDLSTSTDFSQQSHVLIVTCFWLIILPSIIANNIPDYNSLVYKDCTNNKTTTNIPITRQSHLQSKTLSSLFQQLVSKSSNSKFFKTSTTGNDNTASAVISGLFQCRGDLSNSHCHDCVASLSDIATNTLCPNADSARIQLAGCYLHYYYDEAEKGSLEEEPNLRYKNCEDSKEVPLCGFKELMGTAFGELESGIGTSNDGFYSMNYESVHLLAQCEGDLGEGKCGDCVSSAVQVAQDECGNSVSGEIYMDYCFISYAYYANGIPSDFYRDRSGKSNNKTRKTIAIVVGGAAALGFGLIFLLFLTSFTKKDDDY